jgi:hypothetical protein
MLHDNTITFSWETNEFEFKEKRKDWYWIVGSTAIILIVVAIILQNYLFAFLIGIGGFLMISLASKEPLSLPVEVSDHGIKIYNDTYNYSSLYSFWIIQSKTGVPKLLLLSDKSISPMIAINIHPEIDPMELREYLLAFLDEQEMQESLTDKVINKIGF